MKIKDYKCKCGHNDFFFVDKGNQKGIYCTYCGKWLKWADKDEQNLAMKQEPTTKNDLGVDCISREQAIEGVWEIELAGLDNKKIVDMLKKLPSVAPQEPTDKCTWIKYDHRTMCPKEHMDVDSPYWRIPENRMETLKYCPYCGKEIEVEE